MKKVTDKDGAIYARKLAKEEGIFCGYSAGSAIASLIQMKDQFTKDDVIVVLLHDHGSRYVGKIYNDEWMKEMGWLEERTNKLTLENKKRSKIIFRFCFY